MGAVPLYALLSTRSDIYTAQTTPKRDVAIVFGAGLEAPGKPSNFLESRLLMGLQLYQEGKVRVLLVSGDNRRHGYNEPAAMKQYLVAKGVPEKAIVTDYAGFNTYATCYRAHKIFGLSSAILVTHNYHLPRALMTCNATGVKSVGVAANRSDRYSKNYWFREILSLNKAAGEIITNAKPDVLGRQETSVSDALK